MSLSPAGMELAGQGQGSEKPCQSIPQGIQGRRRGFPSLIDPVSSPSPTGGLRARGLLEGGRKPASPGSPSGQGSDEGRRRGSRSAVSSALISRLLWLSPPLLRPLRQACRAVVGSVGRQSPLGCRHGSRQIAPSSPLK